MTISLPFLTSYDPPGTSEGSLDPLGLYQIADQLATLLVPAVRERMQRIRFLTAMAVGALVCEGLDDDPGKRDASPYLVWEWLVVEALICHGAGSGAIWGVPGTLVARRTRGQHGYLDARSYLKTPRIFGFHGVYKRLATHLGLVDVHLGSGPDAEGLVDAWARDRGLGRFEDARKTVVKKWSKAVERSLAEAPPRTKPGWDTEAWQELATAFDPSGCRAREKRWLRDALTAGGERRLGALPTIWSLQADAQDDELPEETLHDRLETQEPSYGPLLAAIRAYEGFARHLQDAFDVLKADASRQDASGYVVPNIASDADFKQCVSGLDRRFETAHRTLGNVILANAPLQSLFHRRFAAFGEPTDPERCALLLCSHHEAVQRAKSAEGKRPWFDRIGPERISVRHAYREEPRELRLDRYLHTYRGRPVRQFYGDLT
ncbi:MAG TPA: hypothetical protein VGK32_12680 [Vicinamibacterales bacterium]|jgi:hypothetical protein